MDTNIITLSFGTCVDIESSFRILINRLFNYLPVVTKWFKHDLYSLLVLSTSLTNRLFTRDQRVSDPLIKAIENKQLALVIRVGESIFFD